MGSLAARTTRATARTRTWGGGRSQTSARIVGRHRSVADMFWRFEDLWQSPRGDIRHAVKLPVDRTLRPPEIPVDPVNDDLLDLWKTAAKKLDEAERQ